MESKVKDEEVRRTEGIWRRRAQGVLLHLLSFPLEFPTGKQSINECEAMNFSRKQEMLKFPIAGLGISGG